MYGCGSPSYSIIDLPLRSTWASCCTRLSRVHEQDESHDIPSQQDSPSNDPETASHTSGIYRANPMTHPSSVVCGARHHAVAIHPSMVVPLCTFPQPRATELRSWHHLMCLANRKNAFCLGFRIRTSSCWRFRTLFKLGGLVTWDGALSILRITSYLREEPASSICSADTIPVCTAARC